MATSTVVSVPEIMKTVYICVLGRTYSVYPMFHGHTNVDQKEKDINIASFQANFNIST